MIGSPASGEKILLKGRREKGQRDEVPGERDLLDGGKMSKGGGLGIPMWRLKDEGTSIPVLSIR